MTNSSLIIILMKWALGNIMGTEAQKTAFFWKFPSFNSVNPLPNKPILGSSDST